MKTLCVAILGLTVGISQSHSQSSIVSKFVARSFTQKDTTVIYRLFVPETYTSAKKYPIVLALHGAGERGTDTLSHIVNYRLATVWADPVNQTKHPCFVLAPQCSPLHESWDHYFGTLITLLDSLSRQYSLDTDRIYLTGLSMGGFGTWALLARYPEKFAVGVPMSGGITDSVGFVFTLIRNIPIWNFHGTLDEDVPVEFSRHAFQEFERIGELVTYTHCRSQDCVGLPDSLIAKQIRSRAHLLSTEFERGTHFIWPESYDFPYLLPWVFSHTRPVQNAIRLTSPSPSERLSGITTIAWMPGGGEDSVEIWYTSDRGKEWHAVASSAPNSGTFQWSTSEVSDAAFGQLRLIRKNQSGLVMGRDVSGLFSIDNAMNGSPAVRIQNLDLFGPAVLESDSIDLSILVGDPERSPLTLQVFYSVDEGLNTTFISSQNIPSGMASVQVPIRLVALSNSTAARFKAVVSDGINYSADSTLIFSKQTPRLPGPPVVAAAGSGRADIRVNIVDPNALTGHLYRVMFDDTSQAATVYDVRDLNLGTTLVTRATEMDGRREGPYFDGLRLLIRDVSQPEIDNARSGWTTAAPTIIGCGGYLPSLLQGDSLVPAWRAPYDYRISFTATITDTSSGELPGFPATPVRFTVWNLTENRKAEFVFSELDMNGEVSNLEEIYILERDSSGALRHSWGLTFAGQPEATLPQPGDQFELRTLRPISSRDIFEFRGVLNGVGTFGDIPAFQLLQNFPNPFNPSTTISFTVANPGVVALTVYDILGREVTTLMQGKVEAGTHSVNFPAAGLASGVYFYRLVAGSVSETKKLLILR